MSQTNYSNEDLFLSTTQVCRTNFFSCEPPVVLHLIRQITSCKFPGLVLALTSLAWSRDSRPKQEILDDLLEQARQVRLGQKAWGDLLSVQARQHQEKDSLDHQQPGENANEDVSFPAELYCWYEIYVQFCQKQFCRKQSFERQFSRRAKEPDGENLVNSRWTTC